ncbi:LuxR C-terminal-related transcriptional regulator [Amycolatopsis japonica]|uniref:helix-turn-helix transcriptional regulator n=1 Tax=Amycolatopsis japonica TaxID=208439 RepID=UPI00366E683D
MLATGKSNAAAVAFRNLETARSERTRLGDLGRWSEADEATLHALREVLSAELPEINGAALGGLVYVAGSPRPGPQLRSSYEPIPPERVAASCALLLVNRGAEARVAVDAAHSALRSSGWRDLGTFWQAVLALMYADERDAAQFYLDRAMACPTWSSSNAHNSALTMLRARAAASRGKPSVAYRLLTRALKQSVYPQLTEVAVAWAITSLVDVGDLDRADALLRSYRFNGTLTASADHAELLAARGALHLASGCPQLAYKDFIACGRELADYGVTNPAVIAWRSQAALCAAACERRSLAFSLAQDEHVQALRWGTSQSVGTALRAVALVSQEGHDVELLEEAVDHLAHSGTRCLMMRAQYELGVKLSFQGKYVRARSALMAARIAATTAGSRVWAARADEALRRWVISDADGKLTSQELRVVNLARAGLGNKEIAHQLHLVNSTVEYHLSNVYRKLGITNRSQLRKIMVPVL